MTEVHHAPSGDEREQEGLISSEDAGSELYTPYSPPATAGLVPPFFATTGDPSTATGRILLPGWIGNPARIVTFVLSLVGSIFFVIGVVFDCVALFVTSGWHGSVNGVPSSPEQATFVGRLVFGILGGVFTLLGAILLAVGVRSWLRQRDKR